MTQQERSSKGEEIKAKRKLKNEQFKGMQGRIGWKVEKEQLL